MRTLNTKPTQLFLLLSSTLLTACGGGGSVATTPVAEARTLTTIESSAPAPTAPSAPAPTLTSPSGPSLTTVTSQPAPAPTLVTTSPAKVAPGSLTDVTPIPTPTPTPTPNPPASDTPLAVPGFNVVTDVRFQNTTATPQTNVPVTFGQVFAAGHVVAGQTVVGKLADGTSVPMQVEVKARHPDGSARHAIISATLPALAASQVLQVALATVPAGAEPGATTPTELLDAGFTAAVNIDLGGRRYTASADQLLRSGKYLTWLSGPFANEWHVSAPLTGADGVAHPHLTARFAIRANGASKARVDVTIENNWAYEPAPQNFTYDAQILVAGRTVYSKTALAHVHHARWRKLFWWGAEPTVHVRHNIGYLIASKAVPNYDRAAPIAETALVKLATDFTGTRTEPMGSGAAMSAMPTTGGRPDIGIIPGWATAYLLSMDKRAKDVTLRTADLAGSWSAHYRNKTTDRPVTLEEFPYMTILGNPGDTQNPKTGKRESFPVCATTTACNTINKVDSSHQPGFAYLPYLVTGDYYYLEELQFYSMYNSFLSNPGYRQNIKGLLAPDQVRAQAWGLRTLSEAAYITPDTDRLKAQLITLVGHNLNWYNTTYSNNATANKFAVLVNGAMAYHNGTGIAPWQDDFFTAAVGHSLELGFTAAQPLLVWKTKFPVMRMVGEGSCWINGAMYSLIIRDTTTSPYYTTLSQAILKTQPVAMTSLPCPSQSLATYLNLKVGEMSGYAGEVTGYPSNMQPALAYAAEVGGVDGANAWSVFAGRSVKPNYGLGAQFSIIPRTPQ